MGCTKTKKSRTSRRRMFLAAAMVAVLASACGFGSGDETGVGAVGPTIEVEQPAVEPVMLAEPPAEQFCRAGVDLAAARLGGIQQFLVPEADLEQAFADVFSAQQTMLGWGPPELKPDLEAIGSGVFDIKKVFFDHGYDPEAVTSSASAQELAVLRGFTDGELGERFDRVVATWALAWDGDRPAVATISESAVGSKPAVTTTTIGKPESDSPSTTTPAAPTTSTATQAPVVNGHTFCGQDADLIAAMQRVAELGRGTDRFVFGDAHTEFYRATTAWRVDVPELFDATFTVREFLVEIGQVFPTTGDLPTVADAFEAVWADPAWVGARAEIDQWRTTNCGESGATGNGAGSSDGGVSDQPTAQQALAEAAAESILRGQDDLSELVDTVAAARCIAEGVVADIGVDRYDAAYGVNVRSLEENLTVLGVGYDLIDAEAVAAAIESCVELEPVLRQVMTGNGVDASAHDCVVANDGVSILVHMIEAELAYDFQRVDRLVASMNEVVAQCGG